MDLFDPLNCPERSILLMNHAIAQALLSLYMRNVCAYTGLWTAVAEAEWVSGVHKKCMCGGAKSGTSVLHREDNSLKKKTEHKCKISWCSFV